MLLISAFGRQAAAETYAVGPSRPYKKLQDVQMKVKPGDVVEVDGDVTYPGGVLFRSDQSGTADKKVTVRGIKVNGKRPILSGGTMGLENRANHFVFESLEITGATTACINHKADDVTIRDFVVRDCAHDGLIGNDNEAGSLTLERSEFFGSGSGQTYHQIYMTTAQHVYPGAVFRMQHCYVHDGRSGNNVKSRSERNEIRYNWIESAYYHNLELIGADGDAVTSTRREDSDVIGNVIVGNGSQNWHLVRIGGDKPEGESSGRYRFLNNTFVVGANGSASIVRLSFHVDTLEMHNNAIIRAGAGTAPVLMTSEVQWVSGPSIFGSNNWVADGITSVPGTWTHTLRGAAAGMVDLGAFDFRPNADSPLLDKGQSSPASVTGREFPSPLGAPAFVPPSRTVAASPIARTENGALDIGAYEYGSGAGPGIDPGPGADGGTGTPATPGGRDPDGAGRTGTQDGGANRGSAGGNGAGDDGGEDAAGCGVVGCKKVGTVAGIAGLLGLVSILSRRRSSLRRK